MVISEIIIKQTLKERDVPVRPIILAQKKFPRPRHYLPHIPAPPPERLSGDRKRIKKKTFVSVSSPSPDPSGTQVDHAGRGQLRRNLSNHIFKIQDRQIAKTCPNFITAIPLPTMIQRVHSYGKKKESYWHTPDNPPDFSFNQVGQAIFESPPRCNYLNNDIAWSSDVKTMSILSAGWQVPHLKQFSNAVLLEGSSLRRRHADQAAG
jgi:hypothetical protein